MMNRNLGIATLTAVLLCLIAGCAKYWYQEGKTFDQCKRDRFECFEEMKKYSPHQQEMGKYEYKFMKNCMVRRGYRLVTARKLHVRVKREDPNLAVPWQVNGVAGFLEPQE
ncbi:MAG: hypothetical protein ACYS76_04600 [Planctomycetota bacterium]|jgi:hypothetical protein